MADTSAVDPLGEALHFLRMRGLLYCRSEFTAPWALELPPFANCMMFHVVTAGQCWLEVEGSDGHLLRPGELALVPHGEGHRLSGEQGIPAAGLFEVPRELISDRYEVLRHGGGGAPTTVICGVVRFDDPAAHHLVSLLPQIIAVDTWSSPEMDWIQQTLRLMAVEAKALRAGGDTVITRLADILIIQAIRSWIASAPPSPEGWLAALRDRQIGRAMTMIHRDPTSQWTVASLAKEVGMSRSAFSARFTRLVGEPAMHYVARWKMHAARTRLVEHDESLAEVATRLGYESEAAFSRAFKRIMGVTPGEARRAQAVHAGEESVPPVR